MDELIAVFRAHLDEDEMGAAAATKGPWFWDAPRGYPQQVSNSQAMLIAETYAGPDAPAYDIEHIARHDPTRVLAEVEADRQLLAAYEAAVRRKKASRRNYSAWINGDPEPYSVLPDGPDEKAIPGLEIAIRIRAVRFDRDADYREEWKP